MLTDTSQLFIRKMMIKRDMNIMGALLCKKRSCGRGGASVIWTRKDRYIHISSMLGWTCDNET